MQNLYHRGTINRQAYTLVSEIRRETREATYAYFWQLKELATGRIIECRLQYDYGRDDDELSWRYADDSIWNSYMGSCPNILADVKILTA